MEILSRRGTPAMLGGALIAALFTTLALAEAGHAGPLDVVENHGVFHILQAPAYALLLLAILQARAVYARRETRLARFGGYLAMFGFSVGVIAGAIVPFVEFALGIDTAEGTLDAVVHMPEFMPFVIGTFLLGLGIAISRLLPRQYGVLLALGAVAMFVLGAGGGELSRIPGVVAYGLGWIALGLAIREPRPAAARTVAYAR